MQRSKQQKKPLKKKLKQQPKKAAKEGGYVMKAIPPDLLESTATVAESEYNQEILAELKKINKRVDEALYKFESYYKGSIIYLQEDVDFQQQEVEKRLQDIDHMYQSRDEILAELTESFAEQIMLLYKGDTDFSFLETDCLTQLDFSSIQAFKAADKFQNLVQSLAKTDTGSLRDMLHTLKTEASSPNENLVSQIPQLPKIDKFKRLVQSEMSTAELRQQLKRPSNNSMKHRRALQSPRPSHPQSADKGSEQSQLVPQSLAQTLVKAMESSTDWHSLQTQLKEWSTDDEKFVKIKDFLITEESVLEEVMIQQVERAIQALGHYLVFIKNEEMIKNLVEATNSNSNHHNNEAFIDAFRKATEDMADTVESLIAFSEQDTDSIGLSGALAKFVKKSETYCQKSRKKSPKVVQAMNGLNTKLDAFLKKLGIKVPSKSVCKQILERASNITTSWWKESEGEGRTTSPENKPKIPEGHTTRKMPSRQSPVRNATMLPKVVHNATTLAAHSKMAQKQKAKVNVLSINMDSFLPPMLSPSTRAKSPLPSIRTDLTTEVPAQSSTEGKTTKGNINNPMQSVEEMEKHSQPNTSDVRNHHSPTLELIASRSQARENSYRETPEIPDQRINSGEEDSTTPLQPSDGHPLQHMETNFQVHEEPHDNQYLWTKPIINMTEQLQTGDPLHRLSSPATEGLPLETNESERQQLKATQQTLPQSNTLAMVNDNKPLTGPNLHALTDPNPQILTEPNPQTLTDPNPQALTGPNPQVLTDQNPSESQLEITKTLQLPNSTAAMADSSEPTDTNVSVDQDMQDSPTIQTVDHPTSFIEPDTTTPMPQSESQQQSLSPTETSKPATIETHNLPDYQPDSSTMVESPQQHLKFTYTTDICPLNSAHETIYQPMALPVMTDMVDRDSSRLYHDLHASKSKPMRASQTISKLHAISANLTTKTLHQPEESNETDNTTESQTDTNAHIVPINGASVTEIVPTSSDFKLAELLKATESFNKPPQVNQKSVPENPTQYLLHPRKTKKPRDVNKHQLVSTISKQDEMNPIEVGHQKKKLGRSKHKRTIHFPSIHLPPIKKTSTESNKDATVTTITIQLLKLSKFV